MDYYKFFIAVIVISIFIAMAAMGFPRFVRPDYMRVVPTVYWERGNASYDVPIGGFGPYRYENTGYVRQTNIIFYRPKILYRIS
ncbi:hypothetical protein A2755_01265 [Candidatus Wolfebacteria bacterium RIFCSPHIGHO2_01_FULL_48_22]|uniref:Uncharacterized protein n=2 Tax=Candidatus Wolfeibacteriota TaxID=1752735 RepID=A0A1F8DWL5_9BACT|nr:MAG: hypothetical protein A2755_01265 [Candidatus Wolfebacteria bacterium RIFCSPHIGHO2_01_FULL_48_22]OGM93917.1 MAG: hypothetical protein A2935_03530 [Candidatus Wolfebacteria bacterium RIFCSPLOWO2_01_FULL_47_17b]